MARKAGRKGRKQAVKNQGFFPMVVGAEFVVQLITVLWPFINTVPAADPKLSLHLMMVLVRIALQIIIKLWPFIVKK